MINLQVINLTNNHTEAVYDIETAMRETQPAHACHPLENPTAACLTAMTRWMLETRKVDLSDTPLSIRLDDFVSAKPPGTYNALNMEIRMTPVHIYICEPENGEPVWHSVPQPDPETGEYRSSYAAACRKLLTQPDVRRLD